MLKSKTTTVITLTLVICAMASQTSAQTSPQALETAQPILSQSTPQTVKSIAAERTALPKGMTAHKTLRDVTALPTQNTVTQPQHKNVYSGVINAKASEKNGRTRFIYSRRKDDTHMPVYFSKEPLKSK